MKATPLGTHLFDRVGNIRGKVKLYVCVHFVFLSYRREVSEERAKNARLGYGKKKAASSSTVLHR